MSSSSSRQPSSISISEELPQIMTSPPSPPVPKKALALVQPRSQSPSLCRSSAPGTPGACPATPSVGPEGSDAGSGRRFSEVSSCTCQSIPSASGGAPPAVVPFCHSPYGFGPMDYPMERPSVHGAAREATYSSSAASTTSASCSASSTSAASASCSASASSTSAASASCSASASSTSA
eukprot:RCo005122